MSRREIIVRVAGLEVGTEPDILVTMGLGSCVAILLHDRSAKVGGMAHILLPSPALSRADHCPGRFPQTALPCLLEMMAQAGAQQGRVTARLVGGASMFAGIAPPGTVQMGERNLVACRQALQTHGIPLVDQASGGDYGRTARLYVADGRVEVSSVAHGLQVL